MTRFARRLALLAIASACGCSVDPGHEDWRPAPAAARPAQPAAREACANRDPNRQAFFGDLHVHTGFSMDARTRDTLLTPHDAYRFAKGEPITIGPHDDAGNGTRRIRIDRTLDFAAVTDHAEWMGEVKLCTTPGSASYDTKGCAVFRGEATSWLARIFRLKDVAARISGVVALNGRSSEVCGDDLSTCREALGAAWRETQAAAERFYDRSASCGFTTFHAWEYSRSPGRSKVHRNVILRNEIVPEVPLSWIDTEDAEALRRKLRRLCNESGSGCDAIVIPHNPNLSNGRMFSVQGRDLPIEEQRARATWRAAMEPVVEMVQMKGESECRNGFYGVAGGPDELCDFEKIRDMPGIPLEDCREGTGVGALSGKGCTSRLDYVRYALVEGLRERERIGVNPYAFGFIGSSDTHNVNPGDVAEWQHPGSNGSPADSAVKRLTLPPPGDGSTKYGIWRSAAGLVGLWSEENSRDALFDALRRREAFATSGPRIAPRLFAGWDLPPDLCEARDFAARGYASGVPMGSTLPARPAGAGAPRFAVSALADAGTDEHPGGLLQRLQVIKLWLGEDAQYHQRVYDVAGDARNGATVDPRTCSVSGPGARSLCSVWRDPEFSPARASIYYARVVENPSCRWSALQCLELPPDERPDGCRDPRVPKVIQERAWTSPVWYTPGA